MGDYQPFMTTIYIGLLGDSKWLVRAHIESKNMISVTIYIKYSG